MDKDSGANLETMVQSRVSKCTPRLETRSLPLWGTLTEASKVERSSDVNKVSIQSRSSRKPSASLSYIYFPFHSTLEHLRQLDSLHSPGEVHNT